MNAQYILNKCRLQNLGIPSMTTGDGNCLFNAVSIALTGNEDRAAELRLRTSVEMALNADTYQRREDYDQLMTHSPSYSASMKDCCTEGAYSSIWTMMALSSVVGLPIKSVYPPMNGTQCKAHNALSKFFVTDDTKNRETLTVMWRLNVADEILDVLGMVNDHPFVQTIIHNKDQVPNIILYTNEQILDLKHFVKYAKNQQIGIDRTFNLGTYYVTTLVYKNQRIIRKPSKIIQKSIRYSWGLLCCIRTQLSKRTNHF